MIKAVLGLVILVLQSPTLFGDFKARRATRRAPLPQAGKHPVEQSR